MIEQTPGARALAATHTAEGTLSATPPFDFAQTLRFIAAFTPMAGEQQIGDGALRKAVMVEQSPVVFTVDAMGDLEQPCLRFTLASAAPLSDATERAAVDRIRFFLSLDDDLRPFYAAAQASDPAFLPVIQRLHGFHQVKFLTPFENACWAVLTQRTPMAVAHALKQRLVARWAREEPSYFRIAEEMTDEGLLVTLRIRDEKDILTWLLGWGSHLRVLEPESLRQRIAAEAAAMLRHHQE